MASQITFSLIINYMALAIAVWLGWYVVTRSPRNLISWLTSLTLWSVGGLFLNMLLALNPPPAPADTLGWLRVFFPFWPVEAFEGGWTGWLQGWQVTPAIVFWHHATLLMRPGGMNPWRWTRVLLGYALALAAIWVQIFAPQLFIELSGDPLVLNTLQPGPLFLPFLSLLILFTLFSLINLFRSAIAAPAAMPRRQFLTLGIATLIAGATAPAAFISVALGLPLPSPSLTILLMIAVILIGYGVARYSALIEGRTIRRDFLYNGLAMGMITLVYSIATWVSVKMFDVPPAAFVFVIMLTIITHNLVDAGRRRLDSIFYRRENQQLRANLRKLAGEVGEQDLAGNISLALAAICNSVRATFGLVLLFEDRQVHQVAGYNFQDRTIDAFSVSDFSVDDVTPLALEQLPQPLKEAALLVPLYVDTTQIGALVLGSPVNSLNYSADDIEKLLYPSDRLAEAIHTAQREAEYLQKISEFAGPQTRPHDIPTKEVENALRNLYDYALLGDTPLATLKLVDSRLSETDVTYIDRGKAVNRAIVDALEKLHPDTDFPGNPPPREWHPYIILRGAYIEDKLNRDIMSQLYISEGTFNRTRRAAIRSLARILGEMETAVN